MGIKKDPDLLEVIIGLFLALLKNEKAMIKTCETGLK